MNTALINRQDTRSYYETFFKPIKEQHVGNVHSQIHGQISYVSYSTIYNYIVKVHMSFLIVGQTH